MSLPHNNSPSKRRKKKRNDASIPSSDERQQKLLKKMSSTTPSPVTLDAAPVNNNIENMRQALFSGNLEAQLIATFRFSELLSTGSIPLIDEVIKAPNKALNVVARLVSFLTSKNIDLQAVAACTLTNIAAGSSYQTIGVVHHRAVEPLVKLLSSSSDEIKQQAASALGNIAVDSPKTRDHVIDHDALLPLLSLLENPSRKKISMLKSATWALLNLCRENFSQVGKYPPSTTVFEQILCALPDLRELLLSPDKVVVLYVCWTLSILTRSSRKMVQAVVEANICSQLALLLRRFPTSEFIEPALLILGDIAASDDDNQTQILIDAKVLPCLRNLLLNDVDKIILIEVCWIISNITAGTSAQIQAVIDADLISPLVGILKSEFELRIKKEALWAIVNATYGSREQIEYLVDKRCLGVLIDFSTCADPKIVTECKKGRKNIMAQTGYSSAEED